MKGKMFKKDNDWYRVGEANDKTITGKGITVLAASNDFEKKRKKINLIRKPFYRNNVDMRTPYERCLLP